MATLKDLESCPAVESKEVEFRDDFCECVAVIESATGPTVTLREPTVEALTITLASLIEQEAREHGVRLEGGDVPIKIRGVFRDR